jgi:hypothetical protein
MKRSTAECSPVNEKPRSPGIVRGIEGARLSSTGEAATNSSRAAPGPLADQGRASSRETLSNTRPILSSGVVARMRNSVVEVARRRSVCPPETSKVRNGNSGGFEAQVRMGVRACACLSATVNSYFGDGEQGKGSRPCGVRRPAAC